MNYVAQSKPLTNFFIKDEAVLFLVLCQVVLVEPKTNDK